MACNKIWDIECYFNGKEVADHGDWYVLEGESWRIVGIWNHIKPVRMFNKHTLKVIIDNSFVW